VTGPREAGSGYWSLSDHSVAGSGGGGLQLGMGAPSSMQSLLQTKLMNLTLSVKFAPTPDGIFPTPLPL